MSYVSRGSVLALGVTFIITSLTVVSARFALRLKKNSLGTDDWLCLPAMTFVLGGCSIMIAGYATNSLGTHSPQIGPAIFTLVEPSYQLVKKFEFAMYAMLVPALLFLKLSTLFFYRRLFRGTIFQICFWILSIFSVLWAIAFFVVFAAACRDDVENNFTSVASLRSKCIDTFTILVCQSILDVAVDLAILILPIPFIFSLKMSLKRKLAVTLTLVVGALAIACGIYRMVLFVQVLSAPLLKYPKVGGMRSDDAKGIVSALCMWSMLEIGVGMVAICLPTLRPLFKVQSLESVARSVRSMISLHSTTRAGSNEYSDLEERSITTRKHYPRDMSGKVSFSATASSDSQACQLHQEPSVLRDDTIIVQKTFQVSEELESAAVGARRPLGDVSFGSSKL